MNITWLSQKKINKDNIEEYLSLCESTNQFTNIGPVIPLLESYIRDKFLINSDKAVILAGNGTTALHALVGGFNTYYNKDLKYFNIFRSIPVFNDFSNSSESVCSVYFFNPGTMTYISGLLQFLQTKQLSLIV